MALRGKYEQSTTAIKVVQFLGCMFLFFILSVGIVFLFPSVISQDVVALKWMQLIQMVSIFLLPALCMAYLWSEKPLQYLHIRSTKLSYAVFAILLILVAMPAINLFGAINQKMTLPAFLEPLETWMRTREDAAAQVTDLFMNVSTYKGLVINILLMALLPAVAEEITFRGIIQRLFTAKRYTSSDLTIQPTPHVAIWCTAILFSAIHMQFYGFLPRMLMGALFGYVLAWTGSLWLPILMHFTNNAMAVILYFVSLRAGWDMDKVDTIGTNDTLWLGVVSIVLTVVGIYAFRRSTTMSNASSRISNGN